MTHRHVMPAVAEANLSRSLKSAVSGFFLKKYEVQRGEGWLWHSLRKDVKRVKLMDRPNQSHRQFNII
jgi:hypothetical protein